MRSSRAWLAAWVLLLASAAAASEPLNGKVIAIQNGDTITVLVADRPVRVRLAEIDAPEKGQPWGNRAKQALSAKVFGKVVALEVVDTDRYGRTVAHVALDGRDIGREMVREGNAWVYGKYMRDASLLDGEAEARAARAGLWNLPEADRAPPGEARWRGPRSRPEPGRTIRIAGGGDRVPCEAICR